MMMDKSGVTGKKGVIDRKRVVSKKSLLLYLPCLLALCLFMLGQVGCRLAKDDGLDFERDKLIGLFITTEHLDLFDFESYFNDNISKLIKKGEEISLGDQEKYGGRIYAVLKEFADMDPETGVMMEHNEYLFEDLRGMPFYHARFIDSNGNSYSGTTNNGGVSNVWIRLGEGVELEGTIYIVPGNSDVFYFNPVYQASDGRVYLVAGTGLGGPGDMGDGGSLSQTMEEKQMVSENGQETEESFKVTVRLESRYPAERIGLVTMDKENRLLSNLLYEAEDLPETIGVPDGAAYLIVETRCRAARLFPQARLQTAGDEIIRRELINPDEEYLTVYTAREDGICEAKPVTLQWGKK